MMAIIADVHGNFSALAAVLDDIQKIGCQQIISLGDVAGYYCQINECIDMFREKKILHILGNHDHYLLSRTQCPRSRSANICLAYQQKLISAANRNWLATSQKKYDVGKCSFRHGGWKDPVDEYMCYITEEYFSPFPQKYFFSAHTHVQILAEFGDIIYCNPGSVGQPRDGDPRSSYALFDGKSVMLRRVQYNYEEIMKAMKDAGFESYYYENLQFGFRIGGLKTEIKVMKK